MTTTALTTADLDQFIAAITAKHPNASSVWDYSIGKKFARVMAKGKVGSSNSAYGFVNMETGDFFKPAGWASPAKGVRGNILTGTALAWCGEYGVAHIAR